MSNEIADAILELAKAVRGDQTGVVEEGKLPGQWNGNEYTVEGGETWAHVVQVHSNRPLTTMEKLRVQTRIEKELKDGDLHF